MLAAHIHVHTHKNTHACTHTHARTGAVTHRLWLRNGLWCTNAVELDILKGRAVTLAGIVEGAVGLQGWGIEDGWGKGLKLGVRELCSALQCSALLFGCEAARSCTAEVALEAQPP